MRFLITQHRTNNKMVIGYGVNDKSEKALTSTRIDLLFYGFRVVLLLPKKGGMGHDR